MKKVLIIAPHPDDAEYGVGGYLAENKGEVEAHVVVVNVESVPMGDKVLTSETRIQEAVKASKYLGYTLHIERWAPDNQFDKHVNVICAGIERYMNDLRPDALFVPLPSFNQDHQGVFTAAMAATRPTRFWNPPKMYAYEYPMQNWGAGAEQHVIMGRTYFPLSQSALAHKCRAISCYESQIKGRSMLINGRTGVMAMARMRGVECGAKRAELFYLIRSTEGV